MEAVVAKRISVQIFSLLTSGSFRGLLAGSRFEN
jgi:hypothetical protein